MQNLSKHVARILNRCIVHLDLDIDRSTIDIVGIGISISRPNGDDALVPLALMLFDNVLKTLALNLKLTAQLLECRCCQISRHASSSAVRM